MAVTPFGVRLEKNHLGRELSILAQKLTVQQKKHPLRFQATKSQYGHLDKWVFRGKLNEEAFAVFLRYNFWGLNKIRLLFPIHKLF